MTAVHTLADIRTFSNNHTEIFFPTESNMYGQLSYPRHTDMSLTLYIRSLHTSDTIPMFRFSAYTVSPESEADH